MQSRIDPFSALEGVDPRYIDPPGDPAGGVVEQVKAGLAPILWVGHPGLGKSTALRQVATRLAQDGTAVFVDVGRLPGGGDPSRVLFDIAVHTVQWWAQDGPEAQPTPFLVQDLRASDPAFPQGQGRTLPPAEIAQAAFDELGLAAGVERVPLIVDGVDALPAGQGRAVLLALLELDARAALVVTGSPALATGAANRQVVDRYRVRTLNPWEPDEPAHAAFMAQVARKHLAGYDDGAGIPDEVVQALIGASGGVLRDLLALTRDAWAYAEAELDAAAVERAVTDRTERYRRLVLDGDRAVLAAAHLTTGLEVPADRKARLLEHGLLLEYGVGTQARVRVHPLVKALGETD